MQLCLAQREQRTRLWPVLHSSCAVVNWTSVTEGKTLKLTEEAVATAALVARSLHVPQQECSRGSTQCPPWAALPVHCCSGSGSCKQHKLISLGITKCHQKGCICLPGNCTVIKALRIPLMSVTSTLNSCCLPGTGICCVLFELFVWSWVDYLRSENGMVHIIKYTRFIVQEGAYAKVTFLSFKCRQLNNLSCGHSAWNSHWMWLLFWTKRTERPCSLRAHKARGKDYLFSLTCTLGALLIKHAIYS